MYLDAFLQTRESRGLFVFDVFVSFTIIFSASDDVVVAAEELRYAAQEIGKITGRVGVEDVLDAIFREFCIGK